MASRTRKRRGVRARIACLAFAAAGASFLAPAAAQSAIVTVGSPLTAGLTQTSLGSPGSLTIANVTLAEPGANVSSPVDGMIVRWRVSDFSGGPFYLRVLRPSGATQFTGAGTSAPQTPAGTGRETFTTSLPIKTGDFLGVDTSNKTDALGAAAVGGSSVSGWSPVLKDGATAPPLATSPTAEIAFSAEIIPVPVITALTPPSGSIAGGTSVKITGQNLAGATAVSFGGAPAAVFPSTSDSELTVVAPKATKPGPVDLIVTTQAGQSALVAADKFTYTACVVPQLKGKKVKAAKKKLKKAGCRLGKVKGKKSSSAKVKKQSPKAGKVLATGGKVNVTLDG